MIDETLLEAIDKMEKAVEHVQGQFATVRTGRATPALVEKLMVEYYGSDVPLQQLKRASRWHRVCENGMSDEEFDAMLSQWISNSDSN